MYAHIYSYNQTLHDEQDVHHYLSQHVHISLPLNEGLHHIHMTTECSPHEGCVSITLRTITAVLLSPKHVLILAVRNRGKIEHISYGREPHPSFVVWHFWNIVHSFPWYLATHSGTVDFSPCTQQQMYYIKMAIQSSHHQWRCTSLCMYVCEHCSSL